MIILIFVIRQNVCNFSLVVIIRVVDLIVRCKNLIGRLGSSLRENVLLLLWDACNIADCTDRPMQNVQSLDPLT